MMPTGRAPVLAGLLAASLLVGTAWAARNDRTRPLVIDAGDGALTVDRAPGRVEIKGPVLVTKGSLLMRAGGLVATEQAAGFHVLASAAASGTVSFAIDLDAPGARMEAQADQVEYEESTGIARFLGNARFRRLVGGQVESEYAGDTIVLNTLTEAVSAQGKPRGSAPGEGGLRIVLMPPTGASAAASPAASAVPLQTAPALTPKPPSK